MALKDRLNALRAQSGRGSDKEISDLAERVRRMRPRGALNTDAPHTQSRDDHLAAALGAVPAGTGLLVREERLPLDHRHGHFALIEAAGRPRALPEAGGIDPARFVFLDTETTGLAGGTGTAVFMLGMARLSEGALLVRQYLLTAFAGESAMLSTAAAWLEDTSALVTFNGKRFDLPLLAARCRLAGVDDRFNQLPHVDLLYPTRRAYRSRWEDCRLATAENRLLGFTRDNDLPGAQAPAAWLAFLASGQPGLLPAVARHNHWDLVSLAVLLAALDRVHHAPGDQGADAAAVARGYLHRGEGDRALRVLETGRDQLDAAGRLELARLYRQRQDWPNARDIWEELATDGCIESIECLAKYHEHVRRDYTEALNWARRLPAGMACEHRTRRLDAKLAAGVDSTHIADFVLP